MAAYHGQVALVNSLIDAGASTMLLTSNGSSCLHLASQRGHVDVVELLLENLTDSDINLKNSCGKTALFLAVLRNHLNVVKALVERGANVGIKEENGWSPLHVASAKGYFNIMKYLLQKGGSIFSLSDLLACVV